MPYKHEDRTLPMDVAFTLGEYQYPSNWLRLATAGDKESIGITWEAPIERQFKDKRWYTNRVVDGEVVSKPKDLGGLKEKMIGDAKKTAHNLLSGSDWMVIRSSEGAGMPDEGWSEWRAAVRAEANRQEEQIATANDVDSLAAIEANWPESPDEKVRREKMEALRSEQ